MKKLSIVDREYMILALQNEITRSTEAMIPDKAKYHYAILLKEFLEADPHIILEFPPLYSPEVYFRKPHAI
jgi:hypothetical protein